MNSIKKGGMFGLDARVAMLIIAILGLFVYPVVSGVISKSRAEAILGSARSVNVAIESYVEDTGSIPSTIDNLFTTQPTNSEQANKWNGPYLKGSSAQRFVPTLTWTLMSDDCSSTTLSSRYCIYRVTYNFCQFPKSVYVKLADYFDSADQGLTYTAGTECINLDYGYAKSGTDETYISFKVKEKP